MGKVQAVCISETKGTQKVAVDAVELVQDWGVRGDAHAGDWHRQVSLLSAESARLFKNAGAPIHDGSFGENIVVDGFDFKRMPVGTRYLVGDEVELEQTQTGKHCHDRCEIYHIMGDCIMPREGVFARVVKGGTVRPGDRVIVVYVPSAAEEAKAYEGFAEKWPQAIADEEAARKKEAEVAERKRAFFAERIAKHVSEVLDGKDGEKDGGEK